MCEGKALFRVFMHLLPFFPELARGNPQWDDAQARCTWNSSKPILVCRNELGLANAQVGLRRTKRMRNEPMKQVAFLGTEDERSAGHAIASGFSWPSTEARRKAARAGCHARGSCSGLASSTAHPERWRGYANSGRNLLRSRSDSVSRRGRACRFQI